MSRKSINRLLATLLSHRLRNRVELSISMRVAVDVRHFGGSTCGPAILSTPNGGTFAAHKTIRVRSCVTMYRIVVAYAKRRRSMPVWLRVPRFFGDGSLLIVNDCGFVVYQMVAAAPACRERDNHRFKRQQVRSRESSVCIAWPRTITSC